MNKQTLCVFKDCPHGYKDNPEECPHYDNKHVAGGTTSMVKCTALWCPEVKHSWSPYVSIPGKGKKATLGNSRGGFNVDNYGDNYICLRHKCAKWNHEKERCGF